MNTSSVEAIHVGGNLIGKMGDPGSHEMILYPIGGATVEAVVSWRDGHLICTCDVARKCQPKKKLCNHIMIVLRNKIDRIVIAEGSSAAIWIPFSLATKGDPYRGKGVEWWMKFDVIRESGQDICDVVLMRPLTHNTNTVLEIGFADENTSRVDLRQMAYPYVLEYSIGVTCRVCRSAIGQDFDVHDLNAHEQLERIIKPAHFILSNKHGVCVNCWDAAEDAADPF